LLLPLTPLTALHRSHHAQVWDFSASADARDTEGGASKRSLLEQVAKMRAYLAEQQ
jgi:argininosuccinate lyase